jgi:hypothetical protein
MARGGVIQWDGDSRPGMRLLLWALIAITVGAIAAVSMKLWTLTHSTRPRQVDESTTTSAVTRSQSDVATEGANPTDKGTQESKSSAGEGDDFRFVTEVYENEAAGYSFRYPETWTLQRQGTASRLTRPDRHFVISFGLGPVGGLPVAYDEFVALLGKTYTDVVVDRVDATRVRDSVGVVLKGAATGSGGVRVRFLATILERPNGQRAIGALAASDVTSAGFPPAVREILASFQPI